MIRKNTGELTPKEERELLQEFECVDRYCDAVIPPAPKGEFEKNNCGDEKKEHCSTNQGGIKKKIWKMVKSAADGHFTFHIHKIFDIT